MNESNVVPTQSRASLLLPISLIFLAAAITYFAFALIKVVEKAPALLDQAGQTIQLIDPTIDKLATIVPPLVQEVNEVRQQIPAMLAEVHAIQIQIPEILQEVAAVRESLPPIITEMANVRQAIPPVLTEMASVRKAIPPVLTEVANVRNAIPPVIEEVAAVRQMLPDTLDQATQLVFDAKAAGKQAGEGAVSGLLTGIIKAPLNIISHANASIFRTHKELTEEDVHIITNTGVDVLNQTKIGSSAKWSNKNSNASGVITLTNIFEKNGATCHTLKLENFKGKKALKVVKRSACLIDGKWNFEPSS